MKKIAVVILLTIFSIFAIQSDMIVPVSAAKAQYYGTFTCYAESQWGVSHYTHPNRDYAARRAVQICQANTPPYGYCSFTGCSPW